MSKAITRLLGLKLTIKDRICDIAGIESEARRLVSLKKADVVIVDYIQLVENAGADNREQSYFRNCSPTQKPRPHIQNSSFQR